MDNKEKEINEEYIAVRKSQINFYKNVALYYKTSHDQYEIYKPSGMTLTSARLTENKYPQLFIHQDERAAGIKELQKHFNNHLVNIIDTGNAAEVKDTLCNLVEETLAEPRAGTLQALPETVDIMISGLSKNPDIMNKISSMSVKDYTTALHAVNVMAIAMSYCQYCKLPEKDIKRLALSALLHDLGKTEVPNEILKASRKLTDEEFKIIKSHPVIGYNVIMEDKDIDNIIALGAIEHHEKLDGSGYPNGKKEISLDGQVIGLIDCYEALTNEDRPYRRAKKPFDTLMMLKGDVDKGKFSKEVFTNLCMAIG